MTKSRFSEAIERAVASCDVMIVLIGNSWLTVSDSDRKRRIDNPDDVVRKEIESALKQGIRIIPVLVEHAAFPSARELPIELAPLVRRNAFFISTTEFQRDAQELVKTLERIVKDVPEEFSSEASYPSTQRSSSSQSGSPTYGHITSSPSSDQADTPVAVTVGSTGSKSRDLVFISYSHNDEQWLQRLRVHLKPLVRRGGIDLWDDTRIQTGDLWRDEIRHAIESCKVAVLVVSADFMASDFISNDELPPLLEAAKRRGVRIISLIVSSSSYEQSDLANFQAINNPSKPLDLLPRGEQEAMFARVHREIENSLRL